MPMASVNGIKLYYEVTGSGYPLLFSHEFAGDYRSWEPQVRYFSRRYQVITYNARGYPPSDVPEPVDAYSQEQATDDIAGLMRHLGIAQAHLVGLSMGGYAVLHFGLRYPTLARSLVVAGCGYGSVAANASVSSRTPGTWLNVSNAMGCAPWPPCTPRAYPRPVRRQRSQRLAGIRRPTG